MCHLSLKLTPVCSANFTFHNILMIKCVIHVYQGTFTCFSSDAITIVAIGFNTLIFLLSLRLYIFPSSYLQALSPILIIYIIYISTSYPILCKIVQLMIILFVAYICNPLKYLLSFSFALSHCFDLYSCHFFMNFYFSHSFEQATS